MKGETHIMKPYTTLHTLCASLIALLCALFAPPQRAQAQEAYVHQSQDKATLTFFYDTQRNARQGQTWGIEETKTVSIKIRGKKYRLRYLHGQASSNMLTR